MLNDDIENQDEVEAAWSRRIGSCNANRKTRYDKDHFIAGWNRGQEAMRTASAAPAEGREPTGDELRKLVREIRDASDGPCDAPQPSDYVLGGWRAARAAEGREAVDERAVCCSHIVETAWPVKQMGIRHPSDAPTIVYAGVPIEEPQAWSFCPECGSTDIHHQEGSHKQCANCFQEWFSDIDYSEVVRKHLSGRYADKDSEIEVLRAALATSQTITTSKAVGERAAFPHICGNSTFNTCEECGAFLNELECPARIPDDQIAAWGCQHEAKGLARCVSWCKSTMCPVTARAALATAPTKSAESNAPNVCMSFEDWWNANTTWPVSVKNTALLAWSAALATAPTRPTDDALWDQTLRERDNYHEWADKLANAVASHLDVDIGEHSNVNNPWAEALEAIESATAPTMSEAVRSIEAATIERCAKVCENHYDKKRHDFTRDPYITTLQCAAAIRDLAKKEGS